MNKKILVEFEKPIHGYWDGGTKSKGEFNCEIVKGSYEGKEKLEYHYKWGSWEFNFWFRLSPSKNPTKQAIVYLKKHIKCPLNNKVRICSIYE